jgi:[citrate (pro-3S)-lyase] ligase
MDELRFAEMKPLILKRDRECLEAFLKAHDLAYEDDIEFAIAVMDTADEMVGCGCCSGSILKCFAVNETLRGMNIIGRLTTKIVQNRYDNGYMHLFIFTKPEHEAIFAGSGFYLLARSAKAILLENLKSGLERYFKRLTFAASGTVGAIVMNCNPFTLGHQYLVEYAAKACDFLYVFIVEEDASVFPFDVRIDLVKAGVSHLKNVAVIPSGSYIISRLTFPTYFLKEKISQSEAFCELDAELFATKIAKALNISIRFVGEEPNCQVTYAYNRTLEKVLGKYGIAFREIKRRNSDGGDVISASTVRKKLVEQGVGDWMCAYLPETTRLFFKTEAAQPILDALKNPSK